MLKIEKPLQNCVFKSEIRFESLIINREVWKLNPTMLLIHSFYNGYPKVCYEI